MTAALTNSGIPGIGDVAWGDHMCHFYGTRSDLPESLVPYFKAGLENNEQCIWVTSEPFNASEARSALGSVIPNLVELEQRGQLVIFNYDEWYTRNQKADAEAVIKSWLQREEQALHQGYRGLRVTGNADWFPKEEAWDMLLDYETMVGSAIEGRRVIAMCSYCLARYNSHELLDIISLHQYGLAKRSGHWGIVESAWMQLARQELHRLTQAAEFREQFLGMVTHDLRNPLNLIMLAAHTLMHSEHDLDPDARRKLYERISRSAQRMAQLIADLFDFTRARLGRGLPVKPAPADINAICNAVCEELEVIHPMRHIKLELEAVGQGVWDRPRLVQAISNVVGNALQYSPVDSPVTVRTFEPRAGGRGGAERVCDEVCVEVHNWGDPIPANLLPHLFEPFHRGAHAGSSSGLGLGLFIAERIIAAHGGHLEVRSNRDDGTTLTICLPRRLEQPGFVAT